MRMERELQPRSISASPSTPRTASSSRSCAMSANATPAPASALDALSPPPVREPWRWPSFGRDDHALQFRHFRRPPRRPRHPAAAGRHHRRRPDCAARRAGAGRRRLPSSAAAVAHLRSSRGDRRRGGTLPLGDDRRSPTAGIAGTPRMEDVFRFADDLGPLKIVHIHRPRAGPQGRGRDRQHRLRTGDRRRPHGAGCERRGSVPSGPRDDPEERRRRPAAWRRQVGDLWRPEMPHPRRKASSAPSRRRSPTSPTTSPAPTWAPTSGRWPGSRTRSAVRSACRANSAASRSTRSAPPASASRSRSRWRAAMSVLELKGARVAVQGFGSVGKHAARFLARARRRPGRRQRHERHGRSIPTGSTSTHSRP